MDTRRDFLKKGAVVTVASAIPGCSSLGGKKGTRSLRTRQPETALVTWYSQAGNTARYGKLIAHVLEKQGLKVSSGDYRDIKVQTINHDIIIAGSPVFYYELPENMASWLASLPDIKGAAVASFVSFGGPEGNQHNTLCAILDLLTEKGGCPVGMRSFMNMSTFPLPAWDGPGCLQHRHLPDEKTYGEVRSFAMDIPSAVREGRIIDYTSKITMRQMATSLPLVGMMKLFYRKHRVDMNSCKGCNTCVNKCPTGSIKPSEGKINRDSCILCFGCLNNCQYGAVRMTYSGDELYGFPEFLKKNGIVIHDPMEFIPGRES